MSDWDKPTVIRKGRTTTKEARSNASVNRAMASGNVDIQRKDTAGGNKQHSGPAVHLSKLEESSDQFKVPVVNKSVQKAIMDARQATGMTQKALATRINEKPQIIQEYESGKAIPNQAILAKLERILGVKLRGSSIGTPLAKK